MAAPEDRGALILAEEYFATENNAFIPTLRSVNRPKPLTALADRWKLDPRPWARQQVLRYISEPLNTPGHEPIVKRLFKQAEAARDDEVMAAFLVAFDRQVRRYIRTQFRWDRQARVRVEEDKLVTPRDVLPKSSGQKVRNPMTGDLMTYAPRAPKNAKLFTHRTRYYLRRRAWRYFRFLGHRRPADYLPAIYRALVRYEDADLKTGENILDSWGLMHACFGEHDALQFGATHISLQTGRSLGELTPAPYFSDLWKKPEAAPLVLRLVSLAPARLVRVWAIALFEREHASHALSFDDIQRLLESDTPEAQQFGARLLEKSDVLATLPVASWLRLLQTKNEDALQRICDALVKHVSADRLTLDQIIEMACARPAPVARVGEKFIRSRAVNTAEERAALVALADAKCRAVASELAAFALSLLGDPKFYSADPVIRFFDSIREETRAAAWKWLVADSPGLGDPVLWSRLVESPYDNIRLPLIDFLQRHTKTPGTDETSLEFVWRSVLLGVHRGGRQKLKAVQQIAQTIVASVECAATLLPVLVVAVRSVRGPEAKAGLAAILRIITVHPQLAPSVSQLLPEMKVEEVAA